jgi:hypothetical protein
MVMVVGALRAPAGICTEVPSDRVIVPPSGPMMVPPASEVVFELLHPKRSANATETAPVPRQFDGI